MSDRDPNIGTPDAPALARIGRQIRWLVRVYFLAILLGLVATTLIWPRLLAYQPALAGSGMDPGALSMTGRVAALAALAVPTFPLVVAIWQALRLCELMIRRQLFTANVPTRLRRLGLALVASAVMQPLGGALLSLAVGSFAGAGQRHLTIAISSDYAGVAVVGAVLIAVATAAREAVRLADENSRFV